MTLKKQESRKIVIDITGPQGNAFYLLGVAKNFCKQLGMSEYNTKELLEDMQSSDYEHLIQVFDDNFGSIAILIE